MRSPSPATPTTLPALAVPPHPRPPGRGGAHRDLPVDPDPEPGITTAEKTPVTEPAVSTAYDAADAAAAWERRRRDLDDLAGIIDVLTDVERRADELHRRAAKLVEDWL